jgi:hypothetical protein
MQVYVVEFEKHPGLFKIGLSKDVKQRLPQLKVSHGEPLNMKRWTVGARYRIIERALHKAFSSYRKPVPGEGGTEFFDVVVRPNVERILDDEVDCV